MASVQTPIIPVISRWIAETPGTISLGQGVVSYGPPPEAIAAARRFGSSPADHRYGPVEGLPELVEALEARLDRENGVHVRPESRLVVTAGGNLAFMNAVLAVTDPGDEVILPVPYYFNHEMAIVMAGARPVPVPTTADYQLDVDAIARAITDRTRAVVTVSPNNPTGAVYPEAALAAVNRLCRDRGIFHIHDEAYEYFTYGGAAHFAPRSLPDAAGAHDLAVLAVEGLRDGELADRLHGDSRPPVGRGEQDSGHAAHLPACRVPARRAGGDRPGRGVRAVASRRPRSRAAGHPRGVARSVRPLRDSGSARRVLLFHSSGERPRPVATRGAADPRAPRRGDSRERVRRHERLLRSGCRTARSTRRRSPKASAGSPTGSGGSLVTGRHA